MSCFSNDTTGDREVLDDHNFPGPNDEAEPSGAGPSDGAGPSTSQQGAAGPSTSQQEVAGPAPDGPDPSAHPAAEEEEIDVEDEEERHGLLDALIHRMQREQDGLGPDFEEPLRSPRQRAAPSKATCSILVNVWLSIGLWPSDIIFTVEEFGILDLLLLKKGLLGPEPTAASGL